ncbi:glycosyltransferase family 4 protein [Sphingomonas sinipercae]|uniref:Glycosyltransferase family 4 protein n=1 Tax=Sphingomonas sinipercae TaxID=2714944 RepID=A0A6G7ZKM8_9SPHN|nr:glycosyltransferase family 4 protein [Sphingomonas sinipercae]QIL01456.1 glycosyltransferase family 4 protein [Sphingomonas sinipercae]
MTAPREIGIWAQWPANARWSNEGMTRLLGFLIEGASKSGGKYLFRVIVPDEVREPAARDLATLDATPGRDFTLHSPNDVGATCETFDALAQFANDHVPVEAWLTLFPNFSSARLLNKPVTAIFPDAIPKAFHEFSDAAWGERGAHLEWDRAVRELLPHAARVITFSDHVANRHLQELFGVPGSKIVPIAHAPPDLQPLLPFVQRRTGTPASRAQAATMLRDHCAAQGWDYLRDFPFEDVPFVAVSTQDRVTKNIQVAARAVTILTRERRQPLKLLTTAPLHFGHEWTVLPALIEATQSHLDIVSLPDLPRPVHAALLHCAALAVHPSIFEGGHAPFPFYEAVSIGTPCLMAAGPHLDELAESEPDIRDFTFDPNDADGLATAIAEAIANRTEILERQQRIYSRLSGSSWATVAAAYAEAALGAAAA